MAAEAQARTDEEITKHILSLCNLRTRRNTFSLISRLPTETLAAVFVHYARDYSKHGDCPTSSVPSWVNVSYTLRPRALLRCECWANREGPLGAAETLHPLFHLRTQGHPLRSISSNNLTHQLSTRYNHVRLSVFSLNSGG
jgi:hypothetical protein